MPHLHKKIDFTSEVFIVFNNKVLLRKHDKYKTWLSVGGHIELHEDPVQAAIREVKEEVGLDIVLDDRLKPTYIKDHTTELIPPYYLNRNRIDATHEHVTFVYFAKAMTDTIIQMTPTELSEDCRWFTKEEIEIHPDIISNIKFYALDALRKLASE